MKQPLYLCTLVLISLISCRNNTKVQDPGSSLGATALCSMPTSLAAYRKRMARVIGQPTATNRPLAAPRSRPPASQDVVRRTSELPAVFSEESTLFGVEIEFPESRGLPLYDARELFSVGIKDKLEGCQFNLTSWSWDSWKGIQLVDSRRTPNTITIKINVDQSVVEISTTPMTYAQTASWQEVLDELIFATARDLEKLDHVGSSNNQRNRWSGHLNVSWPGLMTSMSTHNSPLKDINRHGDNRLALADIEHQNMNLLLNLFIDLQNHPQLSMGILGGDIRNATPLAFGTNEEQDILRQVIKTYKGGYVTDLKDLAKRLSRAHPKSFEGRFPSWRYSLVNLAHILQRDNRWGYERGTRIELRGFFSPLSVDAMLANYRIIKARLSYIYENYTTKDRKVMAFSPPYISENFKKYGTMNNFKVHGLIGNLTPAEAAKVYIQFLKEAGLNPRDEYKFISDTIMQRAVKNQLNCPLPNTQENLTKSIGPSTN